MVQIEQKTLGEPPFANERSPQGPPLRGTKTLHFAWEWCKFAQKHCILLGSVANPHKNIAFCLVVVTMACTTPTPFAMFYAQFAPLPSKMQGFLDFLECIQWSVGRVGKRLEEVMDHRTCFGRVSQVVSCKWHEPMLGPTGS